MKRKLTARRTLGILIIIYIFMSIYLFTDENLKRESLIKESDISLEINKEDGKSYISKGEDILKEKVLEKYGTLENIDTNYVVPVGNSPFKEVADPVEVPRKYTLYGEIVGLNKNMETGNMMIEFNVSTNDASLLRLSMKKYRWLFISWMIGFPIFFVIVIVYIVLVIRGRNGEE